MLKTRSWQPIRRFAKSRANRAGERRLGRERGRAGAWQLIAGGALEDAEFGQIARQRRLRCLDPLAGKQLRELLLAEDLTGGDQVADDGVSTRLHA